MFEAQPQRKREARSQLRCASRDTVKCNSVHFRVHLRICPLKRHSIETRWCTPGRSSPVRLHSTVLLLQVPKGLSVRWLFRYQVFLMHLELFTWTLWLFWARETRLPVQTESRNRQRAAVALACQSSKGSQELGVLVFFQTSSYAKNLLSVTA